MVVVVCKPILVFSLSLSQAEQLIINVEVEDTFYTCTSHTDHLSQRNENNSSKYNLENVFHDC